MSWRCPLPRSYHNYVKLSVTTGKQWNGIYSKQIGMSDAGCMTKLITKTATTVFSRILEID